ncbi:MAG: type II toxin-antitoxin system RelE/ParE family toxin [Phycisphaera sp.]|nr:type II toxin-antitoxin system RelE/ParE family toxin [Phycisphaera sp.]
MSRLIVRAVAEADLEEASRWYEQQRAGLGREFIAAVREFLRTIREYPTAYPLVHHEMRRANMATYPYGVFYVFEGDTVSIVAVMHASRHPRRWKRRYGER